MYSNSSHNYHQDFEDDQSIDATSSSVYTMETADIDAASSSSVYTSKTADTISTSGTISTIRRTNMNNENRNRIKYGRIQELVDSFDHNQLKRYYHGIHGNQSDDKFLIYTFDTDRVRKLVRGLQNRLDEDILYDFINAIDNRCSEEFFLIPLKQRLSDGLRKVRNGNFLYCDPHKNKPSPPSLQPSQLLDRTIDVNENTVVSPLSNPPIGISPSIMIPKGNNNPNDQEDGSNSNDDVDNGDNDDRGHLNEERSCDEVPENASVQDDRTPLQFDISM